MFQARELTGAEIADIRSYFRAFLPLRPADEQVAHLLFMVDARATEIAELKRQLRELDGQLASVNAG